MPSRQDEGWWWIKKKQKGVKAMANSGGWECGLGWKRDVYIHVRVHIYIHVCTPVYIHALTTRVLIYMYPCTRVLIYIYPCYSCTSCTHVYVHAPVYNNTYTENMCPIYIHAGAYAYVNIHIHVSTCMHVDT